MIVRYENSKNDYLLIIDENEKFIGEIDSDDFIDAMLERDSFEEFEYQWFYVDKDKLESKIIKNGTNN